VIVRRLDRCAERVMEGDGFRCWLLLVARMEQSDIRGFPDFAIARRKTRVNALLRSIRADGQNDNPLNHFRYRAEPRLQFVKLLLWIVAAKEYRVA